MLNELNVSIIAPTLYANSKSANRLSTNSEFHKQTKHFKVDYHFICEKYDDKTIVIPQVSFADLFTKANSRNHHDFLGRKLILLDDTQQFEGGCEESSNSNHIESLGDKIGDPGTLNYKIGNPS